MSTRADTITDLTDALAGLPGLRAAKMFGEYGLYLGTKVVAFICDDLLYIKPTPGALALISDPVMAPPYPGWAEDTRQGALRDRCGGSCPDR